MSSVSMSLFKRAEPLPSIRVMLCIEINCFNFNDALAEGINIYLYRSSRPKMFCKKDVLTNFAKFTGKHLCWSLLFNKVASHLCRTPPYEAPTTKISRI